MGISVYTELDILRTELKKHAQLVKTLEYHKIYTKEDLNKRMSQFQHYKNRASKYNKNVKKLEKLREYLGKHKYNEVVKSEKVL